MYLQLASYGYIMVVITDVEGQWVLDILEDVFAWESYLVLLKQSQTATNLYMDSVLIVCNVFYIICIY